MQHKVYKFILKFCLSIILGLVVQVDAISQKDILAKAESYFDQHLYSDALSLYNQVQEIKDKQVSLNKAICLIETNNLNEAGLIINDLINHDSDNPKFLFYRAYLFQHQGHYDLALLTYKKVLQRAKSKDPFKIKARHYLKRCRIAQKTSIQTELGFVENLGTHINTKYNDFGAIQSPNYPSLIYFNSDRQLYKSVLPKNKFNKRLTDMYSAEFINGAWSEIELFDNTLKSDTDKNILGFPPDGSSVIYLQDVSDKKSQIKINYFNTDTTDQSVPIHFNSKIKAELADKYIQVHSDSVFLYSSLRQEGLGGYDIFIIKLKDGEWQEPFHLGHSINSNYNEICPFLTQDGKQLFFSSDRPQSIGEYDIFVSNYDEQNHRWNSPKNIGMPINSLHDDLYFRIDQNGNTASFSSDRIGGIGGLDLYVAYLKETNEHDILSSPDVPFLSHAETQAEINIQRVQAQTELQNTPIERKSKFQLKPLFFNTNDRLVYGTQENYLLKLIQLLKENPKSSIHLLSHSSDSGEFNFQLYSSVRQTEEVVNYFLQNGISTDRIFVTGYGSNFPLNDSFNQYRVDAHQMNKRVTFDIKNKVTHDVIIEHSALSKSMNSQIYKEYNTSILDLSYSIEFAKTKQLFRNDKLHILTQVKLEKIADYFHYTTGVYKSYEEAKIGLENIKEYNFSNIKIVAYISGNRIPESELSDQLKAYPDLADYIIDSYSKQ